MMYVCIQCENLIRILCVPESMWVIRVTTSRVTVTYDRSLKSRRTDRLHVFWHCFRFQLKKTMGPTFIVSNNSSAFR